MGALLASMLLSVVMQAQKMNTPLKLVNVLQVAPPPGYVASQPLENVFET